MVTHSARKLANAVLMTESNSVWVMRRRVTVMPVIQPDLMAQLAGMRLRERCNDWDRSPFTAASGRHVSVYEWV